MHHDLPSLWYSRSNYRTVECQQTLPLSTGEEKQSLGISIRQASGKFCRMIMNWWYDRLFHFKIRGNDRVRPDRKLKKDHGPGREFNIQLSGRIFFYRFWATTKKHCKEDNIIKLADTSLNKQCTFKKVQRVGGPQCVFIFGSQGTPSVSWPCPQRGFPEMDTYAPCSLISNASAHRLHSWVVCGCRHEAPSSPRMLVFLLRLSVFRNTEFCLAQAIVFLVTYHCFSLVVK